MPSYLMPLQQRNKFKIHPKQWAKWPDLAQRVFNDTYEHMLKNQGMYLHPGCDPVRAAYWHTTVHNAAWIAADAAKQALDNIAAGRGYARKKK